MGFVPSIAEAAGEKHGCVSAEAAVGGVAAASAGLIFACELVEDGEAFGEEFFAFVVVVFDGALVDAALDECFAVVDVEEAYWFADQSYDAPSLSGANSG